MDRIRRALPPVVVLLAAIVVAMPTTADASVIGAPIRTSSVSRGAPPTPPCVPVALVAVPGSTETSSDADAARARGLLRAFTEPAVARHGERLHVEYLPYPATLDRPPYPLSELCGVEALDRVTGEITHRCPRTRLVLLGYSQGADVVSDLVHRAQRGTVAIRPAAVAGAVMLGSPRRDPDAPNVVAAPGRGVLGPRPIRELDVYAGRVREVCAPGDPICASERLDLSALREGLASGAHRSYPTLPVGADGEPFAAVFGRALDDLVTAADAADGAGAPGPRP